MKRFLTFEEQNFNKAALEFYKKFGPEQTLTANYSGSYPNEPEKAIRYGSKEMVDDIIGVFEDAPRGPEQPVSSDQPEEDYYAMLEAYMGEQYDDIFDTLALISALSRFIRKLSKQLRSRI